MGHRPRLRTKTYLLRLPRSNRFVELVELYEHGTNSLGNTQFI